MKQDIDKLIKEKIDGYEEPFDHAAWDSMQGILQQQNHTNKKVWYWSAAALILGIGIGVMAVTQWTNNKLASHATEPSPSHTFNQTQTIAQTQTNNQTQTINQNQTTIATQIPTEKQTTNAASNKNVQSNSNGPAPLAIHTKVKSQPEETSTAKDIQTAVNHTTTSKKKESPSNLTTNEKTLDGNRMNQTNQPVKADNARRDKVKKDVNNPTQAHRIEQPNFTVIASHNHKANRIEGAKKKPMGVNKKGSAIQNRGMAPSAAVTASAGASSAGTQGAVSTPVVTAQEPTQQNAGMGSHYNENEKTVITADKKVLEVVGEVPATDAVKVELDKQVLAMAVKRSEDTPMPLPKPRKIFKPSWAIYAGAGTSVTTVSKNRNDGHTEQDNPQFETNIQWAMGILKRKSLPLLEFMTGIGFNSFNYRFKANNNQLIRINDSTELKAFTYKYQTVNIPVSVKYNYFQTKNVACYVKFTWGNHFVINKKFVDEVNVMPIQIVPNNNGTFNVQQNQYGLEDFNNQRQDERNAKSEFFNNRSYFSTIGLGMGVNWRWLFAEANYMIEPQVMRRSNKNNFGIVGGVRIPLTK